MKAKNIKQTVFVAMSGGVDSSVTAAILQKQGYEVVGVFMKNWTESPSLPAGRQAIVEGSDSSQVCTSEADFADVRAVCQHLNIPYYTFNFEKEYKKRVLEYFFSEYRAGRTPNPDVMCNKEVKFDLFLKKALSLGADLIATGHHIRKVAHNFPENIKYQISNNKLARGSDLFNSYQANCVEKEVGFRHPEFISGSRSKNTKMLPARPVKQVQHDDPVEYQLLKGVDTVKDQTYFVYNLTQEQLSKCLFPIGEYTKAEVRKLAHKFNLPTADKKDSQGICFIGPIEVRDFLKTVIKPKSGNIVNTDGQILGKHEGAWFYTIGQRRVEGLAGQSHPLYVIATDVKKNLVIVGEDSETYGLGVELERLHLVDQQVSRSAGLQVSPGEGESGNLNSYPLMHLPANLTAKPRYTPEVYPGTLQLDGNKWQFIFDQPERALTPGQSLVLYDGEVCLGGGVIEKVVK